MRPNFLLSIALVILSSTLLSAQCSFPLPPSESGDSCVTSTYLCPLELHEFEGTLPDSININGPSLLCVSGGEANNIQWYRFVVCEEYVELLITPSNCTTINQNGSSFSGMQAGIYSDCDFNELLACVDDGQTSAFTLSGSNFTPGHQVYMFVDGNQGAVCDYKFEIVEGIDTITTQIPIDSTAIATDGMVTGDSDLCTGEGDYGFIPATCTAGGGTQVGCPFEEDTVSETCYEWIITMLVDSIPTVVDSCFNFVGDSTAANITVDWLCPGEYTINLFIHTHTDPYIPKCGGGGNECGEILPLTVNVSPKIENILPTIYLCEGESFTYCGETYTSDTTAYCEIDTCLFEVQPIVFMAPQFNYLGTQFVCESSDCFIYNGMEYCDPGFYSVENFNNQCMEYDEFEIVALQEVSLNTTASNDINCLESTSHISAFVDLQGYNGNIEIVWIDENGNTVGNSLELIVNNGGAYTCIISFPEYDNICTKESSVYIDENTEEVSATLNYGMIDCGNPETVVQYNASQNIINHTWEGPNGFYSTSSNPILTEGGIYQVILTAENGCEFTEEFVVEENIEEPMASFIPHEYWGCLTEMMTLQIDLSSTDWTITWSTGNGNIREDFNDHIQISQPGEYTATILDPFTECEYIVSTIVENDPDMLLDFDLNTSEIYCYGANDGNITIENILGGVAPYNATVNGESMINLSQDELLPGMYEIILTDTNGCEIIKNTEVIELPDIIIDIATELEVIYQSNEMIYLSIESHSDIESIIWTDQDQAVLGEGLELMINISEDTEVRVTVTDIYDCEKVQDVIVKVRLADNVYIPNIFSPNQDGFNDYFTAYAVHSPGTVEELNVYDRWGNLVFSADGASINNEEKGWDGQFNGEPLPAAVYVYQATINNGGGKVETRKGSITLIR